MCIFNYLHSQQFFHLHLENKSQPNTKIKKRQVKTPEWEKAISETSTVGLCGEEAVHNVHAETTQGLTVAHAHRRALKTFPKLTTGGPL